MNVSKLAGDILAFEGEGIVIFCDTDLTAGAFVKDAIAKAGPKLAEELADIGYCELGHAVITQGYNLKAKNLIFLPYSDRDNSKRINFVLFHQAVRGVLSLASLYGLKTLAIPIVSGILPGSKAENEIELIIRGLAKTFDSPSLEEVFLFSKT